MSKQMKIEIVGPTKKIEEILMLIDKLNEGETVVTNQVIAHIFTAEELEERAREMIALFDIRNGKSK